MCWTIQNHNSSLKVVFIFYSFLGLTVFYLCSSRESSISIQHLPVQVDRPTSNNLGTTFISCTYVNVWTMYHVQCTVRTIKLWNRKTAFLVSSHDFSPINLKHNSAGYTHVCRPISLQNNIVQATSKSICFKITSKAQKIAWLNVFFLFHILICLTVNRTHFEDKTSGWL